MQFKNKLVLIFLFGISITNFAQRPLFSFFNYQPFYSPIQKSPYIETYITVVGNSTNYILNENQKFQATIEIVMLFKQDGKIQDFRKYNLKSPEIDDLKKEKPNFIDQQRISIASGIYNFELSIRDINDTVNNERRYTYTDIISVKSDTNDIDMSGIELIEKYTQTVNENVLSKNGYDIIPFVSNYYPGNISKIIFYAEIYNTDLKKFNNEDFLINYFIENDKFKSVANDCNRFKKQKASKVVIVLSEFDIEKLPSGNYNLVIEAKNKKNESLILRKVYFQRSNPEFDANTAQIFNLNIENTFIWSTKNVDTLVDYLKCVFPIADRNEKTFIDNQVKLKDPVYMQKFFYNFWSKRNYNNPEKEWNLYLEQVKMVNNTYSSKVKKGYETDQGRVYLQYGAPDNITFDKHDPSAYPYEIWQYYKVNDQTNRKFVFYNPELSGKDYKLLHSDVKGEIAANNWEMVLHKRDTPYFDFDKNKGIDYYGGHADENFNK